MATGISLRKFARCALHRATRLSWYAGLTLVAVVIVVLFVIFTPVRVIARKLDRREP
jgi:hypothetical protein